MTNPITLSVVVIGKNEGERLGRCLDSVLSMDKIEGGLEVIYVDSASTDGSVALAKSKGVDVIEVDVERANSSPRPQCRVVAG